MSHRRILLIALMLASPALTSARAEVRVATVFGDYMVLQRDKPIPVWGWANVGEEVTVEFAGQSKQAAADDSGKWTVTLAPVAAGGPHTLAIQGDSPPPTEEAETNEDGGRRRRRRRQQEADGPAPGQVLIRDVLVGEVWLCSGQSNMEWPVKHVDGGLTTRDGEPPSHFTIAGGDEQFHEASATIDGDTLLVHSDQVEQPVAVRYAWRDDAEPNLCNAEGLPASPFRTDDFKMVTEGNW